MTLVLNIAWVLIKIFSYGGIAAAFAGVAVFGFHFVRLNARAARTDSSAVPSDSWRGRGAMLGMTILAAGAGMQLAAYLLSAVLPGRG